MALKFATEGAPNTMVGWVVEKSGPIADIAKKTVEIPVPGAGQARIKMAAATVNPVDFKHAAFEGLSKFPAVFGVDGAGTVDAIGEGVTALKVGDRVNFFGNVFEEFGTFAPFAVVDAQGVAKVPEGVAWDVAATSPCAAWTAYEMLFDRFKVEKGKTIYVGAGAGGVGSFAIQLAKNAGLTVFTTASGDNVARLRGEGYEVIDYRNENLKEVVMAKTGGKGCDYVFDMLGEGQAVESQGILAYGGHYGHIALGVPALPNNGQFFNAQTTHHVFTPGNLVRPEWRDKFVGFGAAVNAMLAKGELKVDISKTCGFDEIKDRLLESEAGKSRGKVLIQY